MSELLFISNVFTTAGFLVFLILVGSFVKTLYDDKNECQMTYMYQYPRFVELDLTDDAGMMYENYGLYAYGEGKLYKNAKSNNFTGIPILFIPGHSGSYRQARSMASISLRKKSGLYSFAHFDYFSVDLNGEYSAFHGGVLRRQTDFVAYCIKQILSFYPNNRHSVILIGHSMGGIIARGLFMSDIFNSSDVDLIITLATPHEPVFLLDDQMNSYYDEMNLFWKLKPRLEAYKEDKKKWNPTLISIGGGFRDFQARSGLFYTDVADLNVVTTAIPGVGVSMDHLCILWCKSFIDILINMLYDSVDRTGNRLKANKLELLDVIRYHLVKRTDGKYYVTHARSFSPVTVGFHREINSVRDFFELSEGVSKFTYIMIKINDKSEYESIFIKTKNIQFKDWVGVCQAYGIQNTNETRCKTAINLSSRGFTTGVDKNFNTKYINFDLAEWIRRDMTHVIIQLAPTEDSVSVSFEMYRKSDRNIMELPLSVFVKKTKVIDNTEPNALFYRLSLPIGSTLQPLYAHLTPFNCSVASGIEAVLHFNVPWTYEDSYALVKSSHRNPFIFFRQTNINPENAPSLYAYLNPKCKYSLHIGPSIVQSLVLSTLNLGTMFIGYLAVVILSCLKKQMDHMYQYEEFPSLVYVLQKFDNVYILLHLIRLLTERKFFLILGRICFDLNKFTVDDALTMLTPILLHLYAYLTIHLIRFGLELIIRTLSELLYYLGLKNAVKNFTVAPRGAYKTELFVVLLIAVSWNTCWGIYCIGASTYYLLKLTAFYNQLKDTSNLINAFGNQPERCVHFKAKDVDSDGIPFALYPRVRFLFKSIQGAYHLHFTLFVMMFILTIISVPETISWAYNLWYSETVPLSDAVKVLLVFSYIFTSVWSVNLMYRIKVDLYARLSTVLIFLTVIIITYSLVNIYRLNFIFHVVFFFIAGSNAHINTLRRANAKPSKQS